MRVSVASLSKKFISIFFAATLALGLVPATAFAVEDGDAAASQNSESAAADSDIQAEAEASVSENGGSANVISGDEAEASLTDVISSEGDEASNSHVISTEGPEDPSGEISSPNDGDGSSSAALPAGDMINQEMELDTVVAQAESTRSFCLAQTLESTKTIPVVSAKLPIDTGANDAADAPVEDGAPSSEGEGSDGSEGDSGSDDPVDPSFTLGSSEGDSAAVAAESTVIGSFTYLGMTFAIESGGESVALMAVDYSKLPEEYIQKQVLVIPDTATPDGIDYYSVTRIADDAFASLTAAAAAGNGESADADSDIQAQAEACAYEDQATSEPAEGGDDSQHVISGVVSLSDDPSQHVISSDKDEASPTNVISSEGAEADPNPHVISSGVSEANGVEKSRPSSEGEGEALTDSIGITAITIPASITTIEEDAFSGFDTLQCVIVSDGNPNYSMYDGCLYDKPLSSLLLIPEGRTGAVCIAPSAEKVGPEVFSHCPSVTVLYVDADSAAFTSEDGFLYDYDPDASDLPLEVVGCGGDTGIVTPAPLESVLALDDQSSKKIRDDAYGKRSAADEFGLADIGFGERTAYYANAIGFWVLPEGGTILLNGERRSESQIWVIDKNDGRAMVAGHDPRMLHYIVPETGGSGWVTAERAGYAMQGWGLNTTDPLPGGTPLTHTAVYHAIWKANDYAITYNLDGGTNNSGNPPFYTIESDTITLKNPTKPGCTFGGWFTNSSLAGNAVTSIPKGSIGDKVFYAKWTATNYSISYNLDGGSVSGNPTAYTIKSDEITLKNPTKPGCTFAGWTGSNGSVKQMSVKIPKGSTGNKSYTANWTGNTYILTVIPNGGSISGYDGNATFEVTYASGNNNYIGNAFSWPGHIFDGLWTQASGGTQVYGSDGRCIGGTAYWDMQLWWQYADDLTVYAHWTPVYIGFWALSEGGTIIHNSERLSDSQVWITTLDDGHAMVAGHDPKMLHYIRPDNGSSGWVTAERDGYTMQGWGSNTTDPLPGGTLLTHTAVYHAIWDANTYTVEYWDKAGRNKLSSDPDFVYGTARALAAKPSSGVSTGYTAIGWATSTNQASAKYDFGSSQKNLATSGTVKLYLAETAKQSALAFDMNGGAGVAPTGKRAAYGAAMPGYDKGKPTRTGYSFTGFYDARTGGNCYYRADLSSARNWDKDTTENVTLYAQWSEFGYAVAFDGGEGTFASSWTAPASPFAYESGTITAPSESQLTRRGYTLVGWSTRADPANADSVVTGRGTIAQGGTTTVRDLYAGSSAIPPSITLHPVWRVDAYTISLAPDGGSYDASDMAAILAADPSGKAGISADTVTYTVLTPAFAIPSAKRPGWAFEGWSDGGGAASPTVRIDPSDASFVLRDLSYEAVWSKKGYLIAYYEDDSKAERASWDAGASVIASFDIDGPATMTIPDPVRKGYSFSGWSGPGLVGEGNKGGAVVDLASLMDDALPQAPDEALAYIAHWEQESYAVTYRLNGEGDNYRGAFSPGYAGFSGTAPAEQADGAYADSYRYDETGRARILQLPGAADLARPGYAFAGWTVEGTGAPATSIDPNVQAEDLAFEAQWTPVVSADLPISPETMAFRIDSATGRAEEEVEGSGPRALAIRSTTPVECALSFRSEGGGLDAATLFDELEGAPSGAVDEIAGSLGLSLSFDGSGLMDGPEGFGFLPDSHGAPIASLRVEGSEAEAPAGSTALHAVEVGSALKLAQRGEGGTFGDVAIDTSKVRIKPPDELPENLDPFARIVWTVSL